MSATNPNPPACSPQVSNTTQNGTQCPANKLVVTPSAPIPSGTTVTVTIDYTGRPGVHTDGDGSTEGWFRIATAGSEGSFVTTEPVGNDSWMPMNNHPTAKPTYDIYDTTNIGKVAIGPGELVGYTAPVGTTYQPVPAPPSNPPDANFPAGSVTWHWHSPERIANYLVENCIGAYDLSARTSPTSGVQYWEAQASTITAARKATNKIAMDNQEDIVNFQTELQRAVAVHDRRHRRRHPVGELRGGDAGQDHLRRRLDRRPSAVARHVQPREHAPVVRRQRRRGRVQPHLLEGGLRHPRRVPQHGAPAAIACGRLGTPAGDAPSRRACQPVQRTNYGTTSSTLLDDRAVEPDRRQPVHHVEHVHAAGHRLRRAVADPRPRRDDQRDAGRSSRTYGGGNITEPQLEDVFRN